MAKSSARPRPTAESTQTSVALPPAGNTALATHRPTREQIARRAYELFEARGRVHGHHDEDWMQAERELTLGRR